jgi:hypothetical protein
LSFGDGTTGFGAFAILSAQQDRLAGAREISLRLSALPVSMLGQERCWFFGLHFSLTGCGKGAEAMSEAQENVLPDSERPKE